MSPSPLELFCTSISFKLVLPKKIRLEKNVEIMALPLLKFLATPLPPHSPRAFPNQLQISFAENNTLEKNVEIMPSPPFIKFLATPMPALVVRSKAT